ncbi:hypothetical protein ACTFIR_012831 [Dictyostelium discoideum]
MSIIGIQKSSTAELLLKSWEPSTLKVYSSSYTRFRNFCTLNSLNSANITLVVFMDYLTHLFKHKPPLAFSTINGHRSMLNQLLLLKNQTDIVNDPFITRIMTELKSGQVEDKAVSFFGFPNPYIFSKLYPLGLLWTTSKILDSGRNWSLSEPINWLPEFK